MELIYSKKESLTLGKGESLSLRWFDKETRTQHERLLYKHEEARFILNDVEVYALNKEHGFKLGLAVFLGDKTDE